MQRGARPIARADECNRCDLGVIMKQNWRDFGDGGYLVSLISEGK